jgi:hypothetical protein
VNEYVIRFDDDGLMINVDEFNNLFKMRKWKINMGNHILG